MNKFVAMGRLCKDPEVRNASGTTIARYTLAVDRRFKKDGEPTADFFSCVAFGKGAEFTEKYLRQGTKIVAIGRLEQDNYTDKNGNKQYSWKFIVEEQEFAESKNSDQSTQKSETKPDEPKYVDVADGIVEDLPFI